MSEAVLDPFRFAKPFLHALDPEDAHEWTLRALETGMVPGQPEVDEPVLRTTLFGRPIRNPIGMAAGFDKNARVAGRLESHGFGFVEVGGVTPRPQAGNPRPRVFRLPSDGAVINRMGFPNDGAEVVEARLRRAAVRSGALGINLASNSDSAAPVEDFVALVRRFAPYADYLTLDISCPNVANGQVFLEPTALAELLLATREALRGAPRQPALVAKLSPDLDAARVEALVATLVRGAIDGIIVSNTTLARDHVGDIHAGELGGLSGRPLFARSTAMLAEVRRLAGPSIPLIGVGGIASAEDAYAKIRAGARAVQLYTALIYEGTALVTRIARDLAGLIRRDGFASVEEAVGTG